MRRLGQWSGQALTAFLCTATAACALSIDAKAASSDTWGSARILFYEPFNTKIDPRTTLLQKRSSTRQMKFDAYGRRFELTLEPNEKLQAVSDANTSSTVNLYRGALMNLDGSWARVATRGSAVHGLIWDGAELYVIEPSDAIRDSLVAPLDVANTQTVLFRLSDTILDAGAALCASDSNQVTPGQPATSGKDAYASMARELTTMKRGAVIMQSGGADRRLELSALADAQFRAQFGSDAEAIDQMLVRLNNVDGIFSAELGVQIEVPTTLVYDTASDPLPTTTSSTDLLRKLATFRASQPQLRSRGLTHLFTGRDLDGPTVGIGYVDSLCNKEFGVGLTEIRGRGVWLESLIATHEIGHNFGAVHDGEGQCSAIPINQFLMSPTVFSSNSNFSTCSRSQINAALLAASCITSLPPADLSIASDLGAVHARVGQTFEWDLPVVNAGGRTTQSARVEVRVPSSLSISDAWIAGGHCTSGAGVVDCDLGGTAGGATRSVHLTLNGSIAGSSEISAQIISASDAHTFNNSGSGSISIGALELGITMQTSTSSIVTGASFSASFVITNATSDSAQNIAAQFDLPPGVSASAASVANGSCTLQPLACSVPQLLPGAVTTGTMTLVAQSAGSGTLSARLSNESLDSHGSNDSAHVTIDILPSTTTSSASSVPGAASPGSGGGGAAGLHLLVALLLLVSCRARRANHLSAFHIC